MYYARRRGNRFATVKADQSRSFETAKWKGKRERELPSSMTGPKTRHGGTVLISGNIGERREREKRGEQWMEKATATKFVVIDRRHCLPPLFVGSRVVDKGCDSRFAALSLEDSWRNQERTREGGGGGHGVAEGEVGGFFVRVMVHRSLWNRARVRLPELIGEHCVRPVVSFRIPWVLSSVSLRIIQEAKFNRQSCDDWMNGRCVVGVCAMNVARFREHDFRITVIELLRM